jgi:hypothetical protein
MYLTTASLLLSTLVIQVVRMIKKDGKIKAVNTKIITSLNNITTMATVITTHTFINIIP